MDTKKTVAIRLSERQLEIIEDAAHRVGMQRTEFIRTAALTLSYTVTGHQTWQLLLPEFYAPIPMNSPSTGQEPPPPPGQPNTWNPARPQARRPRVARGRKSR